jgi:hypothetical protein
MEADPEKADPEETDLEEADSELEQDSADGGVFLFIQEG